MNTYTMNNGREIPSRAFGTWNLTENVGNIINWALDAGYRHFDFAQCYGNEREIGRVLGTLLKTKMRRDELFLTSKLWNTYHGDVERGISTTLGDLGVEYLDLYLVHWPVSIEPVEKDGVLVSKQVHGQTMLREFDIAKLWPEMEKLVQTGQVRSIGVSNFGIENLKAVLKIARIRPVCNQIELHPFLQQRELAAFCQENSLIISCYSTLRCVPEILKNEIGSEIREIAESRKIPLGSVIISFLLYKKYVVITKSSSFERIKDNFKCVALSAEECKKIEEIGVVRRYIDPVWFGKDRFK